MKLDRKERNKKQPQSYNTFQRWHEWYEKTLAESINALPPNVRGQIRHIN